ncbi:MAG: toprim domain-containing protein, partial [Sterolibacterium sp.]
NENLLLIPMRIGHSLSGLQMITREGEKKFLSGAITKGAEYLIDNKGMDWYCEGYATALSLRAVLHALKLRYRIHCCFSAHNLTCMAKQTAKAYIIADHDQSGTGEQAAKDAAHPYWISQVMGEDMNDAHKRLGVFRLSQEIRAWLKGDGS